MPIHTHQYIYELILWSYGAQPPVFCSKFDSNCSESIISRNDVQQQNSDLTLCQFRIRKVINFRQNRKLMVRILLNNSYKISSKDFQALSSTHIIRYWVILAAPSIWVCFTWLMACRSHVEHRPQTTCPRQALSCAAASIFVQLYLYPAVHVSFSGYLLQILLGRPLPLWPCGSTV